MFTLEKQLSGDKLKKAQLQDLIVRTIFDTVSDATFHGGTCVWRCYDGKRFSKDIDIYIKKESSIKRILNRLVQEGLKVRLDSERKSTVFYTIENSTDVSLQINKGSREGAVVSYVLVDGTRISSYSLTAESLILEKIDAYRDRRLERDIYDIMTLLHYVVDKNIVREKLRSFLSNIRPPRDHGALRDLIYEGVYPTFSQIVDFINSWCHL